MSVPRVLVWGALAIGAVVAWRACGDDTTPIGGGWYEGRRAAAHMDDRGAKGLLYRGVGKERIVVGRDVYEYRFYPPDCVLWMTGRTLFGACGDRRPFSVASSGSLDWNLREDGAEYLGIFRVDGGRQSPKVRTFIHIDSVRAVAEKQERLDASYQPLRQGGPDYDPALTPVEIVGPLDVNATNEKKETPLHVAARTRDRALLERALTAGARVNAGDYLNATPLILAVSGPEPVDSMIVERLLAAGAYINWRNVHGFTPLMMAIRDDAPVGLIIRMLDRGADPGLRDDDGADALGYAAKYRNSESELIRILKARR